MTKVLGKALNIIELLADSEAGLRITDLHQKLNLDKATIHRLLKTLSEAGYVNKVASTNQYELSLKLWQLGSRTVSRKSLVELVRPTIRELSAKFNHTVYISLLIGRDAVIFDKIDVERPFRSPPAVGASLPIFASASGKAILAHQSSEFIDEICRSLVDFTPHTITDPDRLKQNLMETRIRGYAINHQELRIGISGIAVPLRLTDDQVTASIAISGVSEEIEPSFDEWGEILQTAVAALSVKSGGVGKSAGS